MAKIVCPVCKKAVSVEWPTDRRDFDEFIVIHGDHAFKAYVDKEGFLRRAWPAKLLYASDAEGSAPAAEEPPGEFAVAFDGRRAAVIFPTGAVKFFETEEFGLAVLMAEEEVRRQRRPYALRG